MEGRQRAHFPLAAFPAGRRTLHMRDDVAFEALEASFDNQLLLHSQPPPWRSRHSSSLLSVSASPAGRCSWRAWRPCRCAHAFVSDSLATHKRVRRSAMHAMHAQRPPPAARLSACTQHGASQRSAVAVRAPGTARDSSAVRPHAQLSSSLTAPRLCNGRDGYVAAQAHSLGFPRVARKRARAWMEA